MTLDQVHTFASLGAGLVYSGLAVVIVIAWGRKLANRWMLVACLTTIVQLFVRFFDSYSFLSMGLETLMMLSWCLMLSETLGVRGFADPGEARLRMIAQVRTLAIFLAFSSALIPFVPISPGYSANFLLSLVPVTKLLLVVAALVLLEQVLRNTRPEQRWRIRYLVIGLGGFFGYQLVFGAADILFLEHHVALVAIQPVVIAVTAPFILMALRRTSGAPMELHISRELVFRTGVLVVSGALLMLLSALAYLVEAFGGQWDFAILTLLVLMAAMVLAVIIGSNRIRIRGRQFLARHVYRRKYDYQYEWERVSRQLTETSLDYDLGQKVIRALGRVTESESGALWTLTERQTLLLTSSLRVGWQNPMAGEVTQTFMEWFREHPDAIDLNRAPNALKEVVESLPSEFPDLRFIVPLRTDTRLVGIVGLQRPILRIDLDWEDLELIKLIANESTGFVALQDAERSLSESGKLASYHQIAAFIVHDAKTISAQLTLLLRNAQKHKTNPVFIEDMLSTVDNAVQRLGNMLEHMKTREAEHDAPLDLCQLVQETLRPYEHQRPAPRLEKPAETAVIRAAPAELRSAIGHIVQNAIDAAAETACADHPPSVDIAIITGQRWHEVIVSDNGPGMDSDFIRERLFAPFASTKGVSGMGIGAYQARTYVRALGGDITVTSQPGAGTRFCIRMPAVAAEVS